jgi:hypothetical protein
MSGAEPGPLPLGPTGGGFFYFPRTLLFPTRTRSTVQWSMNDREPQFGQAETVAD